MKEVGLGASDLGISGLGFGGVALRIEGDLRLQGLGSWAIV